MNGKKINMLCLNLDILNAKKNPSESFQAMTIDIVSNQKKPSGKINKKWVERMYF